MISFENLQQTNDEDCNDLIIVQQVRLSEEDSMDYMELDVLLRADKKNILNEVLSDHTGSFSNDILGFIDWSQLKLCLEMCQQVVNEDILQELLAES